MEFIRAILGVLLLTVAIAIWVWFLRNLIRRRINQAMAFRQRKILAIILFLSIVFATLGVLIHPVHDMLLGIIFGIIIGWRVSR